MKLRHGFAKRRARIEIIPLIDIIFFLLATFVMVSLSMVKNQGISVRLPKAVSGVTQNQDKAVTAVLSIKEGGELYFNKVKIESDELHQKLTEYKNSQADPKVYVNGDELSSFGDIVTVLDQVRQSGIEKVSIQTKGAVVKMASSSQSAGQTDVRAAAS